MKNNDLLQLFEKKVYNKGYSYLRCKLKKLKYRIEELFRLLFQTKLLREGFLSKSFAKACILEALYFTSINWANLATNNRGEEKDDPFQLSTKRAMKI